jgi:hypothetical protein
MSIALNGASPLLPFLKHQRLPNFLGRSRTRLVRFGSKADMCGAQAHVCFGPEADSARSYPSAILDGLADYAFAGWTFNVRLS